MVESTALVTGANGFIGQALTYQLLQDGYKVIGQVRSTEKGKQLSALVDDTSFSYVVVPTLEQKGAFDKVLEENHQIETIFHIASPVTKFKDDIESKMLIPAIEGTKNILKTITDKAPQLKHFVYTSSSIAQLNYGADAIADEDSWSDITYEESKVNGFTGYAGSKKFAEKEVWKFRNEQKPSFTITTILPSLVFGPQAYEGSIFHLTSSASVFESAIKSKTKEEMEAALAFPYVIDIRDVVKAHIFAAENEQADGKRLSLSNGVVNADTILKILNDNFPEKTTLKANDPAKPAPINLFNSQRTQALLGPFISPEKTVIDTIEQLIKNKRF